MSDRNAIGRRFGRERDAGAQDPRPHRALRRFGRRGRRLRSIIRLWRLYLLELEIRLAPTEAQRLFILTVGIGALCGLAAVGFHLSIDFFEARLIEPALHQPGKTWMLWTVVT